MQPVKERTQTCCRLILHMYLHYKEWCIFSFEYQPSSDPAKWMEKSSDIRIDPLQTDRMKFSDHFVKV